MKILLIDDHAMFREGLAMLLRPMLADLDVMEAGSCETALAMLSSLASPGSPCQPQDRPVDLIIQDLALPGMSGMEGIACLQERHPEIPIVVMSSSDDQDTVLQALDAGAMGFIPKSSSSSVLAGALQLVLAKGIYLPPSVFLSARSHPPAPALAPRAPAPRPTPSDPPGADDHSPGGLGLTHRQGEVLDLILQGLPAKTIGRVLDLSPATVKTHTSAVLRALKVTNRTQAVIAASRLGWRLKR